MKMNPMILLSIGIILMLAIPLYLVMASNNNEGNAAKINNGGGSGDVQKVVIGFKNFNYYPNTITVKAGKPVSISLDPSVTGCYRGFTIRDFGISKYLQTPQDTIMFTPTVPGTYRFSCSMGMGTGTLIVE
ncbi:MAG TPA: cupredoxin domain-containing protein [Candidatus Nanoarchaeia archaeon]|nr:cupredoxin domain-containing protein [Candidatus Nanoarchaeia archaeon]